MVGLVRLAKFAVALTPVNWVWLSALKASRRTSILARLPTGMILESDRSRFTMGGAQRKNRGDSVTSVLIFGGAKHADLMYRNATQPEALPGYVGRTMRAPQ